MPQPKTPVGRILAEQARQAIPDNLDAWPEILNRLQNEGLAEPGNPTTPVIFATDLAVQPEPSAFQTGTARVMKNSTGERSRPTDPRLLQAVSEKRSRRLALAGLSFAAILALFLIAVSVVLFNGKTSTPAVPGTILVVQTSKPPTTTSIASASTALPVGPASLGEAPQNCGPALALQQLAYDFGPMAGGTPVGLVGISDKGVIEFNGNLPTQWGYPQKVLWAVAPTFTGTISLQGANVADGAPLWFKIGNVPETTPVLDTKNGGSNPSGWAAWPSTLYAPEAGCYLIKAQWPGGSWEITFAAGRIPSPGPIATANLTTATAPAPTATAVPVPTPTPLAVAGLMVDSGSFSKQGKLAFIFQNNLFALDGTTGRAYQITRSGAVEKFAWSYDGTWLAYSLRPAANAPANTLWVSRSDGAENHQLPGSGDFAWSPTTSELALTQNGDSTGLQIISTAGTARSVTNLNAASPFWSPDGSTLAFVSTDRGPNEAARIVTVPAKGGSTTTNFAAEPGNGLALLGWWPNGKGLLFQTIPANSASLSADGLPVQSLALAAPAAAPPTLVKSLLHPNWLSWSPDGTKFVAVEGAGRQLSTNKALIVCDVIKSTCQNLAQPADTVSLDPAWSPDSRRIAFVRAEARSGFLDAAAFAAWEKTRTLWVCNPDGSQARQVEGLADLGGVQNPLWSRDGKYLLLGLGHIGGTVDPGGLWLTDLTEQAGKLQANRRLVAGPVGNLAQPAANGYYGYQDWQAIAAWYRSDK